MANKEMNIYDVINKMDEIWTDEEFLQAAKNLMFADEGTKRSNRIKLFEDKENTNIKNR